MAELVKRIVAAGTVTLRTTNGVPEVLLVHRPRYDDWTLPKGKLEAGEYLATCAVRETEEESSVSSRLALPVTEITYPVGGGVKAVSYWVGRSTSERKHKPNSEVDQVGWFSVTKALRQTSYADERAVIRHAVNLPVTTPLVILRHAKALSRSDWSGPDHDRPLDDRGQREAKELVALLDAYGAQRLVSSSAARCMKSLRPFAKVKGTEVEAQTALTEEDGVPHPKPVAKLLRKLAAETAESGIPAVVCGHRPVLPTMLTALGIEPRSMPPATALIAHLGPGAEVVALEIHKPLG
jgi:8-oxo-(d)GTP phosphatase